MGVPPVRLSASDHAIGRLQSPTPRRNAHATIKCNAFTLIEVLVTMLILSILLPVLMEGLSISLHAASSARHKTEAANLAQDELNVLTSTGTWNTQPNGNFSPDHPEYSWTCQSVDQNYGISEVSVIVSWAEQGQPRQFAVSTLTQTNPTLSGDTTNSTTTGGG